MERCEVEEFLEACVRYRCAGRDVRVAARRVDQAVWVRKEGGVLHFIFSGSWAEGMPDEVCGDVDVMLHEPSMPIVLLGPATDDTASHIPHTGYVIAESNPHQPAYLRLSVADITKLDSRVKEAVVEDTTGSGLCLNGQTLLKYKKLDEEVQHGPAMASTGRVTSYDIVFCLPCPSWPPCAADFRHRHRPHGRPSNTLIQRITDAGCHVVATGHPDSHQKELEWRWSFSVAEKELIHSMDPNMSAAMYVLKIFKKCVWSEDCFPDKPTAICSYYFKTACLWLNEINPYTTDTPSLAIAIEVIEWLVKCYEEQHVPHYFIPSQNLIGHLPLDMCKEVAHTLKDAKDQLELHVLGHCVTDGSLAAVWEDIKQQVDFPEDADLSDTDIAAAFLTIAREHGNSRECLAPATARICSGSEMYMRKELSTKVFFITYTSSFNLKRLLRYSQQWKIPLTDAPEHPLLPVIDGLDDLVKEGCVVMYRSYLLRLMASLYHGLAVSFSDRFLQRLSDCLTVAFSGQMLPTPVTQNTSQASLYPGQAGVVSDHRPAGTSDREANGTGHRIGTGNQTLARACLTTPLPAAHDPRGDLSTERHCLATAEEYYRRGIPLLWPNGYDDEGFSGHVNLAAFYYLSKQWDKAADTLDMELVQTRLARITQEEAITPAASFIHIDKAPALATLPWQQDERLYQALLQGGDSEAHIHPAVLAVYLQARLALRRGDVPRAASALARVAEISRTLEGQRSVDSAVILTDLVVLELSKRQR